MKQPIFIIGAGLWSAVLAERITSELNLPVTILEKRNHLGGNCFSQVDAETGIECHVYGSHIFHTSDENVWRYITRFTSFNDYCHKVWSSYQNRIYPLPINLATINQFYQINLRPDEARVFLANEAKKENLSKPSNLEEKAISLIGRPLYEAFFRGYTWKQWRQNPQKLSSDIITRLPIRFNYNNNYFSDQYEGIPIDGYAVLFNRLLSNPLIEIKTGVDFFKIKSQMPEHCIICANCAIDAYFDFCFGQLEWRSVYFTQERFNCSDYQGTSVINYADDDIPYTRIHEFKHYHPERSNTGKTIIYKEFSVAASDDHEPYYPINTATNQELYRRYVNEAQKCKNLFFGGRLGGYKYHDMDDTIAAALELYNTKLKSYLAIS